MGMKTSRRCLWSSHYLINSLHEKMVTDYIEAYAITVPVKKKYKEM